MIKRESADKSAGSPQIQNGLYNHHLHHQPSQLFPPNNHHHHHHFPYALGQYQKEYQTPSSDSCSLAPLLHYDQNKSIQAPHTNDARIHHNEQFKLESSPCTTSLNPSVYSNTVNYTHHYPNNFAEQTQQASPHVVGDQMTRIDTNYTPYTNTNLTSYAYESRNYAYEANTSDPTAYSGDPTCLDNCKKAKVFNCDQCGKSFNRKRFFIEHMKTHSEKPYKCGICQKRFTSKAGLDYHVQVHSGKKPFECGVCQKKFSSKSYLDDHLKFHSGEKPYQCMQCKIRFSQKSNLDKHVKAHSGEKPYKCDQCTKSFYQKHHLTEHLRSHSGEKPFVCGMCEKKFSSKPGLTYHLKVHSENYSYESNM